MFAGLHQGCPPALSLAIKGLWLHTKTNLFVALTSEKLQNLREVSKTCVPDPRAELQPSRRSKADVQQTRGSE